MSTAPSRTFTKQVLSGSRLARVAKQCAHPHVVVRKPESFQPHPTRSTRFLLAYGEAIAEINQRFGVNSPEGNYSGWQRPIDRRQARSIARTIARRKMKAEGVQEHGRNG